MRCILNNYYLKYRILIIINKFGTIGKLIDEKFMDIIDKYMSDINELKMRIERKGNR